MAAVADDVSALAVDAARDAAAEDEEWAGEDEAWGEDEDAYGVDGADAEEEELLGPRALPADGEPDFESVRPRAKAQGVHRSRSRRASFKLSERALRARPRSFKLSLTVGGAPRRGRLLTDWSTCAACAGRRRSAPA